MPQPHALIVDDSKTAQVRLRKMLERYELKIDTASSAEEALSYLSYQSPAVVFMDHHMEGMDGLEALRIMKSNPATAMIPVIMYTSEKGDVYVGQARAMGALDILSKEVVKPSNLAKVLSSLNIRPRGAKGESTTDKADKVAAIPARTKRKPELPPVTSTGASAELQAVRSQIARLFEIHIADVRQQVADSTKFIVRRLSGDIEDRLAAAKTDGGDLQPPPEQNPGGGNGLSIFFSALVLLGLLAVAFQVVSSGREQRELRRSVDELTALTQKQGNLLQELNVASLSPATTKPASTPTAAAASVSNQQAFLEAVSAAASINPQFEFGRPALSDGRTAEFAQLLDLLDSAQYTGTVLVDLHFGNFCVVQAANGEWVLPDASATLADCHLLADLDTDFSAENQLSLGFVRFLQTQPALAQGRLNLELNSRGVRAPHYAYPVPLPDVKASEWNALAQRNNRISLSFEAGQPM